MQQILVLGGGFAGLWSAVGAARKLDELPSQRLAEPVEVTLVNRDPYHNIRVRNYEADLTPVCVPLDEVLGPIGVKRIEGDVVRIDAARRSVEVRTEHGNSSLGYDRLVFALGSQLFRPLIPGLAEFAFDVDTYRGAARLAEHLTALPARTPGEGRFTVAVVGAGLTGIETACELPGRLKSICDAAKCDVAPRVILIDHNPHVGSDMGESARPVIEEALDALGIERRLGVRVSAVSEQGLTLDSGEAIPAATVVWCAGMRANPLTAALAAQIPGGSTDRLGRLAIDEHLCVKGLPGVFAAGDSAWLPIDGQHASVMSCQHGRPMGRFAGHNVVCDLLGLPMLPLSIDWYVTVLDLGPWGAVYTEGWDRHVVARGATAKATKRTINCERIYPPVSGGRTAILDAGAPVVQRPPAYGKDGDG